ncbi:MAG: hypothetical protein AAGI53_08840 [Planctomycetota bacterium]
MKPDLVIAVDWSARSTPSPKAPSPDACWIAWGTNDHRPPPEYFRTRSACEHRIRELLQSQGGPAIVGFDFPFGYPLGPQGTPLLPTGRALLQELARLIHDDENNENNRFEVAALLNQRISDHTGEAAGPFWGCPTRAATPDLQPTKRTTGVPEFRAVEQHVRETGNSTIQSPWKLFTTGSVGSQALLGLPAIHRLIKAVGENARLWPFESPDQPTSAVFAEIWPSLTPCDHVEHDIKDARQVTAVRDAMVSSPPSLVVRHPSAATEGWILDHSLTG